MNLSTISNLCTPALLYFVISVFAIVSGFFSRMISVPTLLMKCVFVAIWTWFLNFLCSKNHTMISWFLVVIPYLFTFFLVGLMLETNAMARAMIPIVDSSK